jgi:glycerol-1-phosphate dehydrogenase [NAD(P)+]
VKVETEIWQSIPLEAMNREGSVHHMQLPREVIVGHGVLDQVNAVCEGLGFGSPILILTGPDHSRRIALQVKRSLEASGKRVDLSIVEASNNAGVVNAMAVIEEVHPRVVLGVGGGKSIDIAKFSSSRKALPFISIPTAASHDGIASSRAAIQDAERPFSVETQSPLAILADTGVIATAPYRLTASGCGDIIAKYTAVRDWEFAHRLKGEYYAEYAANLSLMSAKHVISRARTIQSRTEEGLRIVLEALISCGVAMSIAGSSRPCSGSEHLFSHALTTLAPDVALHGEQCGVGAIMIAYLQRGEWRLIRDTLRTVGAPTTASELGFEAESIVSALTMAHRIRPDRYTILGVEGLTVDAAETLARETGIID